VAGLAVSLAGGEPGYAAAAYAFGGLVAGVFSRAGRLAVASSFIVVNAAVAFLSLDSVSLEHALFEACAASVIFALAPQSLFRRIPAAPGAGAAIGADDGYIRGLLRDRLDDVSQALAEVGRTTRKVSEGLARLNGDDTAESAAKAVERVCRKCAMRPTCWQFSYTETMEAITLALSTIKRSGGISRSRAPKYLTENCQKLTELLTELNLQSRAQGARSGAERKISLVRGVITDQFEALSLMLGEIAEDVYSFKAYDEPASRKVREYLEREGFTATRARVFSDENERLRVSFMIPNHQVARLSRAKSALDLCGLLDAELDMPQIAARSRNAAVSYSEKSAYAVQIGAFQLAEGQNRLCGDSYDFIENKDGKAHLILSDGMGSGGNAAVDSSMAAELVRQLLAAGASHATALKLCNSALMVKAADESLATLDIATLDLFSGRADFYKAGAAPTFVIKGGKTGSIEAGSMPAGILRGVSFEHAQFALDSGDTVVMVSDGVTAHGCDWVKKELAAMRGDDIQDLCEKLARAAKTNRADSHDDDITVLAARLAARK
jgi:stage II sporulation protein E